MSEFNLEIFLDKIFVEGYSTCITNDPDCRGGVFYTKEKAIDYLTKVKSPHFYTLGQFQEDEKRRLQVSVQAINCLWLDFDGNQELSKEFFEFKKLPIPSYTFQRENRYHVYYILDSPYIFKNNHKEFSQWFKNFARWSMADSSTVATPQSYLRVPYTLWSKKGKTGNGYEFVQELSLPDTKHSLAYFYSMVEANFDPRQYKEEAKSKIDLSKLIRKNDSSLETIRDLLFSGQSVIEQGQGRSQALYNIACRCWDFGLDLESALSILSQFNKNFCEPKEDFEVIKHSLHSAYRYAKGEFGSLTEFKGVKLVEELTLRNKLTIALSDWYYVLESEQLRNPYNGKLYTTVNQSKHALSSITGTIVSLQKCIAMNCLKVVDRSTFLVKNPLKIIEKELYNEINSFTELKTINRNLRDNDSGQFFIEHLKYLTNNDLEFNHVLKFIRHLFLFPEIKIRHSLLFITEEGTGKTILTKFFEKILCSIHDMSYVATLSSKEIIDGHNSKLDSKLLCITNELEGLITYSSQKDFKSWITDDTINITNKYMRGYTTTNYCNFISFSNSDNATFIKKGDRRFFVVQNRKKPKEPSYYKKLYNIIENKYAQVYNFLIDYKIENLDPFLPPPMTVGKEIVQEISKPELTKLLEELYDTGELLRTLGDTFTSKQFIDIASLLLPNGHFHQLTYNKVHYFCQLKEIPFIVEDFTDKGVRYRYKYFSVNGKTLTREEIKKRIGVKE